ncbi:F-box protein At3g07870-like [Papaver somniferum]|uniref:F-box protein At3g07870-like n=1 Tax=Papaver somniferum TaxID=3469 RepID=UPI000E6FAD61|nr:F-box protein At3g07870-like [Papaver somniferum]
MGFGYNASNNNYKVVRIQSPGGIQKDRNKGLVQIYTLGGESSGWRNIGEISCILESNSILWNGSIYWLAWDSNQWKIAGFDLADEEFRYLPTPTLGHSFFSWSQLTLLGGYLSIFNIDGIYERTYIWSFKKKQNDDLSVEGGGL